MVLDVRDEDERRTLRIAGSLGIPVYDLPGTDLEPLRGRNVWIHCAAGFRATLAASLLERAGIRTTIVDDHIDAAAILGLAYAPDALRVERETVAIASIAA